MSYAETDRIYKPMHSLTTSARVKMAVQENDIVANAISREKARLGSIEKNVSRAKDVRELENLMSAQFYLSYANRRKELLESFWSKRDDIAYALEDRACIGREAVFDYYVTEYNRAQEAKLQAAGIPVTPENYGTGDMVLDLSTSPYIEIAQDGQTAQGLVITMSYRAESVGDEASVDHIRSRFGFDFIKEDGSWKIWHLRQLADISLPCTPADPKAPRAKGDTSTYPESNGSVQTFNGVYPAAPKLPHDLPTPYETWRDGQAVTGTPLTKRIVINVEQVARDLNVPLTEPPLPPGATPPPGMPPMKQADWGQGSYLSLGAEKFKELSRDADEVALQGGGASWIFAAFASAVSPAVPCIFVPPLNDYVRVRPLEMGDGSCKEAGIALSVVDSGDIIRVQVHETGSAKNQRELSELIYNAVLPIAQPGKDVYLSGMMPNFVAVATALGYAKAGARSVSIRLATETEYTCCISNDPAVPIGTKRSL